MAECCYYEALRKQRVLDRAYEARCRLQVQKKTHDKSVQVGGVPSNQISHKEYKSSRVRRAQRKIEVVKNDLFKQEMILRDSNLVLGHISPKQELSLRESKHN